MSRSGYVYDCENLELYRANVRRTIQGVRGQAFLRELAVAMDSMPEKILISNDLVDEHGDVCPIGAVCKARGLDVKDIDCEDPELVGKLVGISRIMAAEISYQNDEAGSYHSAETPKNRWKRVRRWVECNIFPSRRN